MNSNCCSIRVGGTSCNWAPSSTDGYKI